MRRAVATLEWEEDRWRSRALNTLGDGVIAQGKRGYALRQADVHRHIHEDFVKRFEAQEELGRTGKKRKVNPAATT